MNSTPIIASGSRSEKTFLTLTLLNDEPFPAGHVADLARGADWHWILMQALKHRAIPLLWDNIKKNGITSELIRETAFPTIWAAYCSQLDWINRFKNKLFSDYTEMVFQRFREEGIRAVCLKGGALVGDIYHFGNRRMHDIDVLASKADRGRIEKLLSETGFQNGVIDRETNQLKPISARQLRFWSLYNHNLPNLFLPTNVEHTPYYKLSIGFDFFDPSDNFSASTDDIIQRAQPKDGESALLVADPYDTVINLCAHIYREATSLTYAKDADDWSVMKFCDLRTFMIKHRDRIDKRMMNQRISGMGLEKPFFFSLYYLDQLYGENWLEAWGLDAGADDRDFLFEISDGKKSEVCAIPFRDRFFATTDLHSLVPGSGWETEFGRDQW